MDFEGNRIRSKETGYTNDGEYMEEKMFKRFCPPTISSCFGKIQTFERGQYCGSGKSS